MSIATDLYKAFMELASDGQLHRFEEFQELYTTVKPGGPKQATGTYLSNLKQRGMLQSYGRGVYGIPGLNVPPDSHMTLWDWRNGRKPIIPPKD